MKKLFGILIKLIAVLFGLALVVFIYLSFVYLPHKVKSDGPRYLEEKTNGRIHAESIRYIPFKGIRLKTISIVGKDKKPVYRFDKLYLKVDLLTFLLHRDLNFRLDIYQDKTKVPFTVTGTYWPNQQKIELESKIRHGLFRRSQTIFGKAVVLIGEKRVTTWLNLDSTDLNLQANLYTDGRDLRIDKLSGIIADSDFDFIGDVQNLSNPTLNIYGTLNINLASLEKLNTKYSKLPETLRTHGTLKGELLVSSAARNPRLDLKITAKEIKVAQTQVRDLSIAVRLENKKITLSKCSMKIYNGEVTLKANCDLKSKGLFTDLNLNLVNLELHRAIADITGKDSPVHGRLSALADISVDLKNYKSANGKTWVSISGSNILQLPLFRDMANVLRFPELRKTEFKEASGNFTIGQQNIQTNDFKIASDNIVIHFKGAMDFNGNLGFDIEPNFSEKLLNTDSGAGKLIGVLFNSATGSFMGEIKLKGTIQKPRYTFKPISPEKIFQRGLEHGLRELFKF